MESYRCSSHLLRQSSFDFQVCLKSGVIKDLFAKGNCKSINPDLETVMSVYALIEPESEEIWELYFNEFDVVTYRDQSIRLSIAVVFGGLILGGAAISFTVIQRKYG